MTIIIDGAVRITAIPIAPENVLYALHAKCAVL